MSKKFKKATRSPRRPRTSFRRIVATMNEALTKVAQELDAMRGVITAHIHATDSDKKVRALLGMPETDQPAAETAQAT